MSEVGGDKGHICLSATSDSPSKKSPARAVAESCRRVLIITICSFAGITAALLELLPCPASYGSAASSSAILSLPSQLQFVLQIRSIN